MTSSMSNFTWYPVNNGGARKSVDHHANLINHPHSASAIISPTSVYCPAASQSASSAGTNAATSSSTAPPMQHQLSGSGASALMPLCSTSDVQLRFLCPDDLEEVRTLCQDWFPIDYPLSWYIDITSSTRFYALAAVYNLTIIGLIVAEIKPFVRMNKEDRDILAETRSNKYAEVAYILSLGVHKNHRRNGIASLLLDALIRNLTSSERPQVKAIFLHVLTTNKAAIMFYEHRNFRMHTFLPYYYSIRGDCKDGFTYVTYINGGHPPWTLLDYIMWMCSSLRKACEISGWIGHRMVAGVRWLRHRTVSRFNFAH